MCSFVWSGAPAAVVTEVYFSAIDLSPWCT